MDYLLVLLFKKSLQTFGSQSKIQSTQSQFEMKRVSLQMNIAE